MINQYVCSRELADDDNWPIARRPGLVMIITVSHAMMVFCTFSSGSESLKRRILNRGGGNVIPGGSCSS